MVLECFRLGTPAERKALILVCCAFKFVQIGGNTKNSACDRIEILDLYIRGGERENGASSAETSRNGALQAMLPSTS